MLNSLYKESSAYSEIFEYMPTYFSISAVFNVITTFTYVYLKNWRYKTKEK